MEEDPACAGCGYPAEVSWCPAWDEWLCLSCRACRTDAELSGTARSNLRKPAALPAAPPGAATAAPGTATT